MNAIEFSYQKELKEVITDHIKTVAIYCFGTNKTRCCSNKTLYLDKKVQKEHIHLYLLLLVHETKENAVNDISDILKTKTQGTITSTLLIHHVRNLKKTCDDQQFFFWKIMQNAELIYQDVEKPPYLNSADIPKRNLKGTTHYIASRKNNIATIWNWVYNDDDVHSSDEVKMSALHQVVEQVCLSLIRVFLGYTPNHFALEHLFHLCEYFTTITGDFFPRITQEDKSMFKLLKQQPGSLRFSKANDVDYLHYQLLEERCNLFHKRASEVIESELKRLKDLEPKM